MPASENIRRIKLAIKVRALRLVGMAVTRGKAMKNYVKCIFEVFLIILVSLLPLLIMTLIRLNDKNLQENSDTILSEFYKYFERGQFGFLTLGICGSVFWMILAEIKGDHKALPIVTGVLSIGLIIFSSMIVTSESALIRNNSPEPLFYYSMYVYAASLFAYILIKARTMESPNIDFTKAADEGYERFFAGREKP